MARRTTLFEMVLDAGRQADPAVHRFLIQRICWYRKLRIGKATDRSPPHWHCATRSIHTSRSGRNQTMLDLIGYLGCCRYTAIERGLVAAARQPAYRGGL